MTVDTAPRRWVLAMASLAVLASLVAPASARYQEISREPRTREGPQDHSLEDHSLEDPNEFFHLEDLEEEEPPLEVQVRADLSFLALPTKRNVESFDSDDLLMLDPAVRIRHHWSETFELALEVEYDGRDRKSDLDELYLRAHFPVWYSHLDAGVAVVPFGIERFYYSPPTNPLVDRPAPFRFVYPGNYSDLGLFWTSEIPLEGDRKWKIELAVSRGLLGPDREDRPDDVFDRNPTFQPAGRIGHEFLPGLQAGVSVMQAQPHDEPTRVIRLIGTDLTWRSERSYVRAEYLEGSVRQRNPLEDFHRRGWYAEFYHRHPLVLDPLQGIEFAARFDQMDTNDRVHDLFDTRRLALGLNLLFPHSIRFKAEWLHSDERFEEIRNDGFLLQVETSLRWPR